MSFAIHIAELLRLKDSHQAALVVVRPRVIGAHNALTLTRPFLKQTSGPVTTCIQKGPRHSITPADDQNRDTDDIDGSIGPRLSNLGGKSQHQRQPLENIPHLLIPQLGVEVIGGRDAADITENVCGSLGDVVQQPLANGRIP